MKAAWVMNTVSILFIFLFIGLLVFAAQALLKHRQTKNVKQEKASETVNLLGEALKRRRIHCNMTQEFVAEAIHVNVQAVSGWESGALNPSVPHLLALATLFQVSPEELLKEAYSPIDAIN